MRTYFSLGFIFLLFSTSVGSLTALQQSADFVQLTTPVLEQPFSSRAGDFNEDGHTDVAISDELRGEPYVTIMLGNGKGGFPLQAHFPITGSTIKDIAIDDFNNDNHLDICAVTMFSSSVSVLLGDGQGHFSEDGVYETGDFPEYVTIGDFDENNYPDLAISHWTTGEMGVMLNDGGGGFGEEEDYDLYGGTKEIDIGDFNEDDHLDLAVATMTYNEVVILYGDGSGSFGNENSFWVDYDAYVVNVNDFNDDQHDDVAVGTKHSFLLLLGDGDGGFSRSFESQIFDPHAISTRDFNEDGFLDAVVSMTQDNLFQVFLGNGDGGFSDHVLKRTLASSPRSLDAADFNEDGHIDLVSANEGSDELSLLLNQCRLLEIDVEATRSIYMAGDEASFIFTISNPQDSIVHGTLWFTLNSETGERIIDPELIEGFANPVEFDIPAGYGGEFPVTFTIPQSLELGLYRFFVNTGSYGFLQDGYQPSRDGQGVYIPAQLNSIVWSSNKSPLRVVSVGILGHVLDGAQPK